MSKLDLLDALSVYHGFTKDIYEAGKVWCRHRDGDKSCGPRYLKPLKYAGQFEVEVEVDDIGKIPVTSRAVWLPSGLKQRCEHCGLDEAEDFDDTHGKPYQLCVRCQDDVRD